MGFADMFRWRFGRQHRRNGKTRAYLVTARDMVRVVAHHERSSRWKNLLAGTIGALYERKGAPHPPYELLVRFALETGVPRAELLEAIACHGGDYDPPGERPR